MNKNSIIQWLFSWQGAADLAWFFLLLFLLWHFWNNRRVLKSVSHWLITKGRITQFLWTKEKNHLWPKIQYTYQLYDRVFTGEYFFLDTSHNNPNSRYSRMVAYRAAIAFEKDEEIDVYYNPNNPNQSALDVRMPTKLTVIIGLIVFFLLVHIVMVLRHIIMAPYIHKEVLSLLQLN